MISSACSNGETVTWNDNNKTISINLLTTSTKCTVNFTTSWMDNCSRNSNIACEVIESENAISDMNLDFNSLPTDSSKGLYYTSNKSRLGEDGVRIYYYRGPVNNNWVRFAGYYWRILRTTSEGGIKLIYSGNATSTSSAFINTSVMFNSPKNSIFSWGYTIGDTTWTGRNNSTVKAEIDNWYTTSRSNNMASNYNNYLSKTAIFCNYRKIVDVSYYSDQYGYQLSSRTYGYSYPNDNSNSRYTVSDTTGNGYLTYPIALPTNYEMIYAGIGTSTEPSNTYILENATAYNWTSLSPTNYYTKEDIPYFSYYYTGCKCMSSSPIGSMAIRPVIAIKPCASLSNNAGTKNDPYTISANAECLSSQ